MIPDTATNLGDEGQCPFCGHTSDQGTHCGHSYYFSVDGTWYLSIPFPFADGVPDVPSDDPLPVDPLRFWKQGLRLERPGNFAPQPLPRCNPQQRQLQRTPPKVPRPPRHNRVAERNRA